MSTTVANRSLLRKLNTGTLTAHSPYHLTQSEDNRSGLSEILKRADEKLLIFKNKITADIGSGTIFVTAGQTNKYVYLLRKGWAGQFRLLPDGRKQYIQIFLPGDMIALKGNPFDRQEDDIEALSDAVVERIPKDVFGKLCDEDNEIAASRATRITQEERRLHGWIVALGRGSVLERLAFLFIQFRSRLVNAGEVHPEAKGFELPMTQQQLADYLGLSLVHLNKSIMKLRTSRMISISGRKLVIADLNALTEMSRPLMDSTDFALTVGSQPCAAKDFGQVAAHIEHI